MILSKKNLGQPPFNHYDENASETLEHYNANKYKNRQVSGDKLPMTWPFFRRPGSSQARLIAGRIGGSVSNILDENNITLDSLEVVFLVRRGFAMNEETLVINTTDDQFDTIDLSPNP